MLWPTQEMSAIIEVEVIERGPFWEILKGLSTYKTKINSQDLVSAIRLV